MPRLSSLLPYIQMSSQNLYLEDAGTAILQNMENHLSNDTVSIPEKFVNHATAKSHKLHVSLSYFDI
jgi:hypothetical protein